MHYEVEQKYPCDDLARRPRCIDQARRGAPAKPSIKPTAITAIPCATLRRPTRRFGYAQSASRITSRTKGPSSTRRPRRGARWSCRWPTGSRPAVTADDMLRLLGFAPVAVVEKRRETLRLARDGASVEVALDEVDGRRHVRRTGNRVEGVEGDAATAMEMAKRTLAALAAELGLTRLRAPQLSGNAAGSQGLTAQRRLQFRAPAHFAILRPRVGRRNWRGPCA